MVKKSLAKGLSVILMAGTLMGTAVPAMAEPTNGTHTEASANDTALCETAVSDLISDESAGQADTPDADTQNTDTQPTDSEEQQNTDKTAVAIASLSSNDQGNKPSNETTDQKDHPVYSASVSVRDGTLADNFAADQIYFDGVFKGSEIQDVQVNSDRTGFTVKFTKAYDSKETNFEGHMYVKGNAILLSDGSNPSADLSLYMYDTYRASEESSADEEKTINEKAVEDLYRSVGNTAIKEAMTTLFKQVLPEEISKSLAEWIAKQGVNFDASEDAAPTEPTKELIAINQLSEQLSQSTKDILYGVEKCSLESRAAAMNSVISAIASQYRNYNHHLNEIKEWNDRGEMEENEISVDNYMSMIYHYGNGNANIASSEGANFGYFQAFVNLCDAITGKNALLQSYNIFQINHGISSCLHNYNTQTFAERREFNQKVMDYFDQGYAALTTAITYDMQKNAALEKAYTDEMAKIKEVLSNNTVTDEAKEKMNAENKSLKAKITNAQNAVKFGQYRLDELSVYKNNIQTFKEKSDEEISNEESLPYVLCYRNGTKYDKAMTVTETTPENFGSNNVSFLNADVDAFTENYCVPGGDETYFKVKDMWTSKDQDGWKCFARSAANKGTSNTNMDYLAKIAQERHLTLEEDLKSAFTIAGDASGVSGFYNGGKFTTDKNLDGHYYFGEEYTGFFNTTKRKEADYYWYNINHVSYYYTLEGKTATNQQSRSFSISSGWYCISNFEGSAHWCHASKSSGDNLKLFVVNLYEN